MRKVLVPAFNTVPDLEEMFAAVGAEIVYALPEEERAYGRAAVERFDLRNRMIAEAFDRLLPELSAVNAMGVGRHWPITAEMIDRADLLETIFIGAAGYDQIDVAAASARGVMVFNAPGGNAVGVAEHAIGLMLSLTRRIADLDRISHAEHRWSKNHYDSSGPRLALLKGKTLGLAGFGFIGRHVAMRAIAGFGMKVVAFDPFYDPVEAGRQGVELISSLDRVLEQSDIVSLHLPLNADTRNIIDARALGLMKPSAYLINTGRGETVDTDALVAALRAGTLAGAALDVVAPEPLPDGHALYGLENAILTPHIGGATPEDVANAARFAARQAALTLAGERVANACNPQAWETHMKRFATSRSR
ncbi:MAG: 3-phosphoglycerate dehydrogenase [Rhodobiaceae bacterium]|nr:3-phosphoglycerate dehydrogenase [Rhodobiaceae bacterium]